MTATQNDTAAKSAVARIAGEPAGEKTIVIVDDDPNVREGMQDLLDSLGFEVLAFASAAEYVLSSGTADEPACLILDVTLPGISGIELQRQLAGSQHPPIVLMTGHADILSSVRTTGNGAVASLSKPFSPEQLLAAIDSAVRQQRRARRTETAPADVEETIREARLWSGAIK